MELVVTIEKKIGETPLEALQRFKREHEEYATLPATYAGRLDPMASGKLVLLFGEECKRKEHYLGLDKKYAVEILLGVRSDTGDILGKVTADSLQLAADKEEVRKAVEKEVGSFEREYPAFSSKTVNGRPLFMYALEGSLADIEVPLHTEIIRSIELDTFKKITSEELQDRVNSLLTLVPKTDEPSKTLGADFRIEDVRASWESVFETKQDYAIARIRIACGSGTYMRTLAQRVGEALGTKALALSIHRTKIG